MGKRDENEWTEYIIPTQNQKTPTIQFDKTGANKKIFSDLLNQSQPRLALCLMKYSQVAVILPDSQERY